MRHGGQKISRSQTAVGASFRRRSQMGCSPVRNYLARLAPIGLKLFGFHGKSLISLQQRHKLCQIRLSKVIWWLQESMEKVWKICTFWKHPLNIATLPSKRHFAQSTLTVWLVQALFLFLFGIQIRTTLIFKNGLLPRGPGRPLG